MDKKIRLGVFLFFCHHVIIGSEFLRGFQERQRVREQRMVEQDRMRRELDQRMVAAIVGINQEQTRRHNFQNVLGFWQNRINQNQIREAVNYRPVERSDRATVTLLARLKLVKKEDVPGDWNCSICLDNEKESRVRATNCQPINHLFHEQPCLEHLLKVDSRCPLCRQNMIMQQNQ